MDNKINKLCAVRERRREGAYGKIFAGPIGPGLSRRQRGGPQSWPKTGTGSSLGDFPTVGGLRRPKEGVPTSMIGLVRKAFRRSPEKTIGTVTVISCERVPRRGGRRFQSLGFASCKTRIDGAVAVSGLSQSTAKRGTDIPLDEAKESFSLHMKIAIAW